MVGETLGEYRSRIESLSSTDGEFAVVCGRTGIRPVPVAGERFPSRETAEAAARAATAYRAVLRRWDPRAPWYDFIACELPTGLDTPPAGRSDTSLSGFCHDVAAAVFDALSTAGFEEIEGAIMDAYCRSADRIDDPDQLCLQLLATLAAQLDRRLDADEQRRVLRTAARALPQSEGCGSVTETFDRLRRVGIIEAYGIDANDNWEVGRQSWTVTVDEYALGTTGEPMPTLPIALDLLRRLPQATLTLSSARYLGDARWQFTVTATETGSSAGLARIQPSE